MTSKPLSKEDLIPEGMLSEIEYLFGPPNPNSAVVQLVRGYRKLLAAEQFWREAVKNLKDPLEWNGICDFCEQDLAEGEEEHKPDCPWVLAHE